MRYLLTLGLIAFVCVVVWMLPVWLSVPAKDTGYVALGALFSALAFAAIFATLIQNQEYSKQQEIRHRSELENLQSQVKVQKDQYDLLVLTSMHTTLMNIIEILNSEIRHNETSADAAMQTALTKFNENMARLETTINDAEISGDLDVQTIRGMLEQSGEAMKGIVSGNDKKIESLKFATEFRNIRKEFLDPLVESVGFHGSIYNEIVANAKDEKLIDPGNLRKSIKLLRQFD